jgi:hypothetical protein
VTAKVGSVGIIAECRHMTLCIVTLLYCTKDVKKLSAMNLPPIVIRLLIFAMLAEALLELQMLEKCETYSDQNSLTFSTDPKAKSKIKCLYICVKTKDAVYPAPLQLVWIFLGCTRMGQWNLMQK